MSMRIAYFDCVFGVSGDMLVGALLDLGLPLADLRRELARVGVDPERVRLAQRKVVRGVIQASKFDVHVAGDMPPAHGDAAADADARPAHEHEQAPEHAHEHAPGDAHGHPHAHAPEHAPATAAPAPHPTGGRYFSGRHDVPLTAILRRIATSGLPAPVRERSATVFQRIGAVEAKIHGVPVETVHFHEIGAWDSIVDVVGTVLGLHLLGIDAVYCSRFPQSWGTVDCRHGRLPLPGPATWELLKGFPVFAVDVRGEMCTPTGVGLLTTLAAGVGHFPEMTVETVGYGAGDTEFETHPNVLRVLVGRRTTGGGDGGAGAESAPAGVSSAEADRLWVVETNLDDMTGQQIGWLFDRVFAAGAVEVYTTPVSMKKNRPGVLFSALVPPAALLAVEAALFTESTTFGVRRYPVERTKLAREFVTHATAFGPVRYKVGRRGGAVATVSPEYEDCRRIAEARGLALREVLAEAQRAAADVRAAAAAAPVAEARKIARGVKPARRPAGTQGSRSRRARGGATERKDRRGGASP
ncbi:MAG: LarC family nickel insertion protein [Planctomycetes bacterium]|nr:LarC family nickel insertion protein [Planctomycetota bacterium]